MKTTTISDRDAFELTHGRVPSRPDLDSLADLLSAYRDAAIGPAPRPSAALSARVDLSATPIAMQRDVVTDGNTTGAATRRAAGGLFGLGITVAIILGAASGAAAVAGMGTAGLLPPGAQDVFDQVVSDIAPPGVDGAETTDMGEAPGVTNGNTTRDRSIGNGHGVGNSTEDKGTGNSGQNNGVGSGGQDNGFGNSGQNNGFGNSGQNNGVGNAGENNGTGNSGQNNGVGSGGQDNGFGNSGQSNGATTPDQPQVNGKSGKAGD